MVMHTQLLSTQGSSTARPLAGPGSLNLVHSPQSEGVRPTAQMWKLRAWAGRPPHAQLLSHKPESSQPTRKHLALGHGTRSFQAVLLKINFLSLRFIEQLNMCRSRSKCFACINSLILPSNHRGQVLSLAPFYR